MIFTIKIMETITKVICFIDIVFKFFAILKAIFFSMFDLVIKT